VAGYQVCSLGSFLEVSSVLELLAAVLRKFHCLRDRQLEDFTHNRATTYEAKDFSRTYLILDTSSGAVDEFLPVAAFFTLAITATDYNNIRRTRKEKVLGSKPGRNTFKAFPGMLIAQLARDDHCTPEFIDGDGETHRHKVAP
jgi:hypothetical protein